MDHLENRDDLQQPETAVNTQPEQAPEETSLEKERAFFRAASDLGSTVDPRTEPVKPEPAPVEIRQSIPAADWQPMPAQQPWAAAPQAAPAQQPRAATPQAAPAQQPRAAAPQRNVPPVPPVYPPRTTAYGAGQPMPGLHQHSGPAYHLPPQPVQPPQPPQPHAATKRKKGGFWKSAIAAVLIIALVVVSCAVTAELMNRHWEDQYQQMSVLYGQQMQQLQTQIDEGAKANENIGESISGSPPATADGLTPSQVYARNVNAVVAVSCKVQQGYASGTSMGSGFILTQDGYIATNYHVVEGAVSISVITHEGNSYAAELIGYDQTNDVAVLKADASDLPCVTIGSSDKLIVGDQVVAIGNPLGELTNTLTVGYVSAKERDVTTDGISINMLQTDAAINSGNSGGPLFNMRGEVVGITTAKYSGNSSSGATIEGIGFAIPIDDVYDLMEDLMTHGYVTGAYLGVMVSEMNPQAADYYGLPLGAYVEEVTPGNCAEAAGLQAKDIITAIGTYKIEGLNDLTRALRQFEPGDTTTITVYRSGEEMVLPITLDAKPVDNAKPTSSTTVPEGNRNDD